MQKGSDPPGWGHSKDVRAREVGTRGFPRVSTAGPRTISSSRVAGGEKPQAFGTQKPPRETKCLPCRTDPPLSAKRSPLAREAHPDRRTARQRCQSEVTGSWSTAQGTPEGPAREAGGLWDWVCGSRAPRPQAPVPPPRRAAPLRTVCEHRSIL